MVNKMPAVNESSTDRAIERKLRRVWRMHRWRAHTRGVFLLTAWGIALFLAAFALDRWFLLSLGSRMTALGAVLAVLGTLLIRRWIRKLRRFNRSMSAAHIERRTPGLLSLLTSYVELTGPEREKAHGSDELKDVVRDIAVETARPVDLHKVVAFRSILPPLAGALWALLALAIATAVWPRHVAVFSRRLLGTDIPYPTRTVLVSITGNRIMKRGASLTVSAKAGGEVPQAGVLHVKYRGLNWQSLGFGLAGHATFAHEFSSLGATFDYYAEIGDAKSDTYRVTVVPPPTVLHTRVRVRPPPYTRVEPYDLQAWNIEVPEGSELEWRVTCDTELADAQLLLGLLDPLPATLEQGGTQVVVRCIVDEPAIYRFRWRRKDTRFVYDDPIHRIYVKPDKKPEVAIVQPRSDIQATVNKTLALKFRARDDYGITRAWLVHSLNDGEELRLDLGKLPLPEDQEDRVHPRYGIWPLVWNLKHEVPDIKVGDKITYAIEVEDIRAQDMPGEKRRTEPQHVNIVSFSDYQSYVFSRLAQTREGLASIHLEARKSRQVVEALTRKAGGKSE